MENEKEYADFLPTGFETWTSFYAMLEVEGKQDDETIHYVQEAEIRGVPSIAPLSVIPAGKTYYKMQLIKEEVDEEKETQS